VKTSWGRFCILIAALLVLALGVAGCGDDKSADANSDANTPAESTDATGETSSSGGKSEVDGNGCEVADRPDEKTTSVSKPKQKLDPSKTYVAKFVTNCGTFTIKLDVEKNPKTAASVANLVKKKFYDGLWFHRIIPGFVIQGGDPLGSGSGDAGYNVVERPKGDYEIGSVAMAKTGTDPKGTSSSQFYVVIGEQGVQLPKDYAIAGKIQKGMDTIERIAGYAGTDQAGTPTGVAVIKKATLQVK
jgi:cyclophilin family peptidyl-prolyl cis-trans isomerase